MAMSSGKFIENTHIIHAFPSTTPAFVGDNSDMFKGVTGGITQSDIISLHGAQRVIFFIINNKVGATAGSVAGGTATITVHGCKRATGIKVGHTCGLYFTVRKIKNPDTNSIISAASASSITNTFTTWGRTNTIYEVEVDACQLPSCSTDSAGPWEFVRMKVLQVTDKAVHGAYVALLDGLRDAEDQLPTQMA